MILNSLYTIHSIADLQQFCEDTIATATACAGTQVDPAVIILQQPLEMWTVETTLSDGSKVYDVTHKLAPEVL